MHRIAVSPGAPDAGRPLRELAVRVAGAGLLACAVVAPLALHWLAGRTLVWFDTQRLYAPQRWIVDEALRAFRLPLWNPFMGAGMPFLADAIHGVLHPVSIVTAWLGTSRSADLLIGGHVACAGVGAGVLARELGASRPGAAVAGFAFGMSGFVLSMAGNLVFLAGAASLPFCVAGLRRFARDPGPGALAFGVAGTAALALSGDVQALVVGGALGLALGWEAGGWRGAARAIAAGAAGLLVASVQLVPSAVHVARSVRDPRTWTPTPETWAFGAWRIPELVAPFLIGGPDPYRDRVFAALAGPGGWPAPDFPMPFASSVTVGLLPAALAVAGLREGRLGRVLGVLALVLLWIALGATLGASAVLGHVPIWRAFRHSEKLVGPLTLVLSALAALGADAILARRVSGRRVLAIAAALAAGAVAAGGLEISRLPEEAAALAAPRLVGGACHALAAAGALGAWLLARRRLGRAAGAALALLGWAGLAAAAPAALHPGDPEARLRAPGPELAAAPPGPRIVTPYLHDLGSNLPGPAAMDLAGRWQAALGYPAYQVRSRLDSLNAYCAMDPTRLALLSMDGWSHWPLAPRRFAITHVLLDPPLTPAERATYAAMTRGATRAASGEGYEIWAVPHREWANFPRELRAVPDERTVLTEGAEHLAVEGSPVVVEAWSPFQGGAGRVLAVERGLEAVRIEAEAETDATLVVADAWWPGWEARLDGTVVPIFRADLLVRAVRWPAGRHVVEMRYRPPEARTGLALSALGLGATAAAIVALARRRRAPRPAQLA